MSYAKELKKIELFDTVSFYKDHKKIKTSVYNLNKADNEYYFKTIIYDGCLMVERITKPIETHEQKIKREWRARKKEIKDFWINHWTPASGTQSCTEDEYLYVMRNVVPMIRKKHCPDFNIRLVQKCPISNSYLIERIS